MALWSKNDLFVFVWQAIEWAKESLQRWLQSVTERVYWTHTKKILENDT